MSMNAITVLLLAVTIGYNAFPTYVSNSIFIRTYVINCFPNTNYTAFITFERDRINRLPYEGYSISNATLQPNSDYLIQFREAITDSKYNLCSTVLSQFCRMSDSLNLQLNISIN